MGIFGDLDIENAKDLGLKVGEKYGCIVTDASVRLTNDKSKLGLNLIYSVISGSEKGQPIHEWQRIPDKETQSEEDFERSKSYLKARLISLGIPEDKINSLDEKELIGTKVLIKMREDKKNPGQLRIGSVEPGEFDEDSVGGLGVFFGSDSKW